MRTFDAVSDDRAAIMKTLEFVPNIKNCHDAISDDNVGIRDILRFQW